MKGIKQKVSPLQKALNLWAIILIVWSIYRHTFILPEWFDEFIAKPLVFVLPVFYYIKVIEKKDFLEDIYLKAKLFSSDLVFGCITGVTFFLTAVCATFVKTGNLNFIIKSTSAQPFYFIVILAFATAISEEILSRGFILKRLYEESGNIISSSFFASILFFFLHVPILFTNTRLTGNMLLLFMATDLILSLINSFLFLQRKSLTLPIFIHAFYNITIIAFI